SAVALGVGSIVTATAYQGWFNVPPWGLMTLAGLTAVIAIAAMLAPAATRRARALVLARLSVLAVLALAIAAPRFWWDRSGNGSLEEKRLAQGKLQQQIAKPEYKPSTIYDDKPKAYYGLELRARGTPLSELFSPQWAWHSHTFFTATASYGWIQFFSPP